MQLQISDIKTKVTGKLRGSTIQDVSDFYGKCQEAAGNVLSRSYPLETIRSSRIEGALFSHVNNYVINQDIRANKGIIDIRPISQRTRNDDVVGRYGTEFDINKERDTFTIEVVNGIKTLRLKKEVGTHVILATLDGVPSGGYTVTAAGDATDIETNSYDYVEGNGALQFGLSGVTGAGGITINMDYAINLETMEDIGSLFNWVNFPEAARLTNVQLRWGTDASNYWQKTVTTPHDRTSFVSGAWSLCRFDWSSATKTGAPAVTNIKYLQVIFNYTVGTAIANVRVNQISAGVGKPYELVYYSNYLFKGTDGTYRAKPSADNDYINIEGTEGANLFLYELMLIIIQELGEKSVERSAKWFMQQLNGYGQVEGLYKNYNRNNPCQSLPVQMTYYRFGGGYSHDEED